MNSEHHPKIHFMDLQKIPVVDALEPAIGVIGGSGLYDFSELEEIQHWHVKTPFGEPSGLIVQGLIAGRKVFFLARHGPQHRYLPTEINHRANIYALRALGVRWIFAVSAVGSLQEVYEPGDLVVVDQFFDRTTRREQHSFFGESIVAHVSLAKPISHTLFEIVSSVLKKTGLKYHLGGTYVNIDGPTFSTQAESQYYHQMKFDVVGMTNIAESKLAREAEIAYLSLCFVTDYDSWRPEVTPVEAADVIACLQQNVSKAKQILPLLFKACPQQVNAPEHDSLKNAIFTPQEAWSEETYQRLKWILGKYKNK
jgi:5'-methylthioadenosine phosphorylase